MAGEDPGRLIGPRPDGGRGLAGLAWSVLLNTVLVAAFAIGLIPIVAIVHGFIDLVVQSKNRSGADWIAYGFAFTGLFLGAVFFAYAIKYYLSTVMVLLTTLVGAGPRSNGARPDGNGLTRINGNGNGNGFHLDLGYHPFVSIHVAAYNEKRVIERLLAALSKLDYPEYEVVVVDDSTDESVQILDQWRSVPRFKVLHRPSRAGFKGGALREALKLMDSRTEYVVVFDADSVPFPDSIQRLLPLFYRVSDGKTHRRFGAAFGRADDPPSEPGQIKKRAEVAAVQSYQWHVLNKSESWLTEAVRAEYAGSYMIERPFQDAIGSLKMIAGTAYMIRADILRQVGWGTSITEDWELTLNLYSRGYKVIYTPWAETPAECVSTFSRLARQRMRWAEGHTHNVRKWFVKIMASPVVTPIEKLEFLYDSTYYLQAGLFVIGSLSWLISEVVFRTHVSGWTAVLGWSLLFSNIFALPLMNLGGLILEEAPVRDLQGVFGALVLSFALVPFQGWAAFKGLISRDEGPWFRTPKTGRVTDEVKHLRRLILLRRWLGGRRTGHIYGAKALAAAKAAVVSRSYKRKLGWFVSTTLAVTIGLLWWQSLTAPVAEAAGNPLYLHGTGTSPGCAPATMGPAPGGRAAPCSFGDGVAYFAYANLPAQTIPAGTWTFRLYWSLGVPVPLSNITLSVGVISGGSCVGFAPALVTWSGTFGVGANPAVLSTTTATAVTIAAGQTLCLKVDLSVEQDDALMLYDTAAVPTALTPPVTVVPESILGFLGVALAIPVFTGRRRWLSWIKVRI